MSSRSEAMFRTFRDPAGSLQIEDERVLRTVHPRYAAQVLSFLNSSFARSLADSGKITATQILGNDEDGTLHLEHPRIFFPSYPWEWSEAQWIDAALLTLNLCDELIDHGLILKDATPLNVLFDGARPVLVDLLSIDHRVPSDPIWKAYGQFVRTFVLPLMAHKYLGWPLTASRARRDGYEPGDLYPHLSLLRRWLGPCRNFITLPVLLDRMKKKNASTASIHFSDDACAAILHARLRGLKRVIRGLSTTKTRSRWSGYVTHRSHYSPEDSQSKTAFIERALKKIQPASVLDIGANTGEFSRMAAETGARVVAMDTDLLSTELHYKRANAGHIAILPLHADIARPTPSAGWKNLESLGLLDRCRHRFDCILMLGLLHHLLVSDQIPLAEIAHLASELAPRALLVEWIPPSDAMFQEICRGRDDLYGALSEDEFRQKFSPYFTTVAREPLHNGRVLFHLEAR